MISCDRCGESNRDDARFCGNCGSALATSGSIASLVDEPTGPPSNSSAGLTSEWVAPPTIGETAPPVAPSAPVAPPAPAPAPEESAHDPASVPTGVVPVGAAAYDATTVNAVAPPAPAPAPVSPATPVVDDSSRSTSVMIAALAVAVVVIVGGIALLLASGGDGDQAFQTGSVADGQIDGGGASDDGGVDAPDDPVDPAITDPSTTVLSATVPVESTTPSETAPTTAEATPTSTVETTTTTTTTDPPTATTEAPVTTTTDVPATAPPSTVARPGRGPGDLGIAQPILDFPCTGDYVTFVRGIVGGDRPYPEQVENGLRDFPGSGYLWGGICPSIRTIADDGDQIYGIIYGPFPSLDEACARAAEFESEGAYVRRLTQSESDVGRDVC